MNKLLVSDIRDLNDGIYKISSKNNCLDLNILGNVTIYLINENIDKINLNLKDASNLFFYDFRENNQNNISVNINQVNNSKVHYNYSFKNSEDCECIINNDIKGNNNESYLSIRNISNKGLSKIIINVKVFEDTTDNIALEDLKGINNGGNVLVEPNIVALSNEVVANHLATIGGVDKASLFYLMSKGINESNAKEILLKGFIYSNMDDFIKTGGEDYA